MPKIEHLEDAIAKTKEAAAEIAPVYLELQRLLKKHGCTKVDDALPLMICADLDLASSIFYTDRKAMLSKPDAYDSNGTRVELKTIQDVCQFTSHRQYGGVKIVGKNALEFFGGVTCYLNYN